MSLRPHARSGVAATRIGKYVLLDLVTESAMSSLYLARMTLGGTSRLVIVKTLSPRCISEAKNRELFFKEIEITMALSHPSIARLYDFGEHEGAPYIVMEWVHGVDTKRLLGKLAAAPSRGIPPALAAWIVLETSKALHHAHTFADPLTGKSIGIVHRDLSPHNVLVSYNGNVKLIDFGVSKVLANQDTMSDTLFGKAPYLSPEQIEGQRLDARSDLFALGAVFFELLTGRRLFDGENDFVAMSKVRAAASLVPLAISESREIPDCFAPVLLKCLAPAREKRYSSAAEIHRDLARACQGFGQPCGREPLSAFIRKHFAKEMEEDRGRMARLVAESTAPADEVDPGVRGPLPELDEIESAPPPAQLDLDARNRAFTAEIPVSLSEAPRLPARPEPEKPRSRWLRRIAIASVALAACGAAGWLAMTDMQRAQSAPGGRLAIDVQPGSGEGAEILLDGHALDGRALDSIHVAYDLAHHLVVRRAGFETFSKSFYLDPPEKGGSGKLGISVDLVPARFGTISVATDVPAAAELTSGSVTWKKKTPFRELKVPPGKYAVRLKGPGLFGRTKLVTIEIAEGQPALVAEKFGE
ncbi:MAG TPA: protein kinase [Bdellovibrionota bacterium]|nr:protein kinase [Bdellovibrionota bacterium]